MHSFTKHLGDYAKDTRHLTLLEHGAYNVLMDWCYASERALPPDEAMLYRICAAFTKPEQLAVMSVIRQFFQDTPDGWIQKRIEAELMKAHEKRGKAKDAALQRWNANAMQTHSEGNANAQQTQCEGITNAMPRGRALRNPVSSSSSSPPNPRQRGKAGKLLDPVFPADLAESYEIPLRLWFGYKRERREGYTQSGWSALLTQQLRFPASIVAASVEASMSSNWAGLFTDKQTEPVRQTPGFSEKKEVGGRKSYADLKQAAVQAQDDELAALTHLPLHDVEPEWDWRACANQLYGACWDEWGDVPEVNRREMLAKKEGGAADV